jgi:multiple sugar transport system substrate-binding protein
MKKQLTLKKIILAAAVLLIIVALTACPGRDRDRVTLTMWAHSDPNYQAMAEQFARQYEAETGVRINLTFTAWDQMGPRITAAFHAGAQPDIIQGVASWLYVQKIEGQLTEVPADLRSRLQGMAPASIAPVEYRGRYFGVPLNVNIDSGMYAIYCVQAFREAGITPGWNTWDAYVRDLQRLTRTSNGTITRSGVQMVGGTPYIQFLIFFLQSGGTFYSPDGRSVQINNQHGERALQMMYDLLNVYRVDSVELVDFAAIGIGMAATVNYGPWYTAILDAFFPDFEWGWARVPTIPNAVGPYFPGTNVWAWMVPESSNNKEAAWDFIRWLNDNNRMVEWSMMTGEIPATKALWDNPALRNHVRMGPWFDVLDYQVPLLHNGPQDVYAKVLTDMIQEVLRGQTSIRDALRVAQDELNQMLASLR